MASVVDELMNDAVVAPAATAAKPMQIKRKATAPLADGTPLGGASNGEPEEKKLKAPSKPKAKKPKTEGDDKPKPKKPKAKKPKDGANGTGKPKKPKKKNLKQQHDAGMAANAMLQQAGLRAASHQLKLLSEHITELVALADQQVVRPEVIATLLKELDTVRAKVANHAIESLLA